MSKLALTILLASLTTLGTLTAFGGKTWLEGSEPLLKRITRRGWLSLIFLLGAFSVGIAKEVQQRSADDAARDESKRAAIIADNQRQALVEDVRNANAQLGAQRKETADIRKLGELQKQVLEQQSGTLAAQGSVLTAQGSVLAAQRATLEGASAELRAFRTAALDNQTDQLALAMQDAGYVTAGAWVANGPGGSGLVSDAILPSLSEDLAEQVRTIVHVKLWPASGLEGAFGSGTRHFSLPAVDQVPEYTVAFRGDSPLSGFEAWTAHWKSPPGYYDERRASAIYDALTSDEPVLEIVFQRMAAFDRAEDAAAFLRANRSQILGAHLIDPAKLRRDRDGKFNFSMKMSRALEDAARRDLADGRMKSMLLLTFAAKERLILMMTPIGKPKCKQDSMMLFCEFRGIGRPTIRPWYNSGFP